MNFSDILAVSAIMLWPLVPLFWIPVHCFTGFFRRLGILTYATPFITWLPVALLIHKNRSLLLQFRIGCPESVHAAGWVLLGFGIILQLWTLRLLGGFGIIGMPEVTRLFKSSIIKSGPFSVVRHPTYVSHTAMLAGVFLITGVTAVGMITILDILIINFFVIPLEDRELAMRFGEDYELYRKQVPAYFPRIFRRSEVR